MKHVLLKISGEQLGNGDHGFSVSYAEWLAREIQKAQLAADRAGQRTGIAIMVGGGNFMRGAQLGSKLVQRVTADNAGMLATIMNAIMLRDVFVSLEMPVRVYSKKGVDGMVDYLDPLRAQSKLAEGGVVILGGGTGNPFVTTDSGAVQLALELGCSKVLKATKVDGVFTDDPETNPDAKKLDYVTYQEAVNNPKLRVMDKAALGAAGDAELPIIIFKLEEGSITRAVLGDSLGTTVGP
ncbi:uridylate kinase [Candidatus Saccharibacteria bacterium]|nr:uridylate kinase [Candidatus Saccharibacteria bacterium]